MEDHDYEVFDPEIDDFKPRCKPVPALETIRRMFGEPEDDQQVVHTGWDRGDYDVDDLGGFSGVEPGGGEYWRREAKRCVERLNDLPDVDTIPEDQSRRRERLKQRENRLRERLDNIRTTYAAKMEIR